MKKAIVVSAPTGFAALAFRESLEGGIRRAAAMGFDAVELAVRDPHTVDRKLLAELIGELGLPVVAVGTGQAYGEEGLSFTDTDAGIRRRAVERILAQIDFAAELHTQVIIGLIRGRVQAGISEDEARELLTDALKECCQYAAGKNVTLCVEPINRYETNLINTVDEALALLDSVGCSNLGLLLDSFHMNIEEPCILQSIRKSRGQIFHFHIADSNRWSPGCGHLDFPAILKELKDTGYDGAVSGEMLPKPDGETAAMLLIESLRNFGL